MQSLQLPSHYGANVEIDVCASCHLVWFDHTETARLSGTALLELIGHMASTQTLAHQPLSPQASCPHCKAGLKTVHNRTRWGASLQLDCKAGHGAYQSFAQFLQEKGLLRPMSSADRARLLAQNGRIDCVNCGAAVGGQDERCAYCSSTPSLLDIARLARALDPEGALAPQTVHATQAQQAALQCGACGSALPPGLSVSCVHCSATLAISRLAQAHESVNQLAPALRAHAAKPAPMVVKRRLDALDTDLSRRRDWVRDMQAQSNREHFNTGDNSDWRSPFTTETNPVRAVLLALMIWFVWWYW
jgi:glutaredoxin